jgi:NaMN:DMB phosphoribosyltransferase
VSALLRWATAGCVGAVALALVLVALQPSTQAQRTTKASLEQSGVRVVQPASNGGKPFEDPGTALRLALVSLAFGVVAGIALGAAITRFGHLPLLALAGFAVSVAVLALVDRFRWRDVGAQAAFWAVTAGWMWWSGRSDGRSVSGAEVPKPTK